jgi:hypothetical protein
LEQPVSNTAASTTAIPPNSVRENEKNMVEVFNAESAKLFHFHAAF